jgi:hypothetical protein
VHLYVFVLSIIYSRRKLNNLWGATKTTKNTYDIWQRHINFSFIHYILQSWKKRENLSSTRANQRKNINHKLTCHGKIVILRNYQILYMLEKFTCSYCIWIGSPILYSFILTLLEKWSIVTPWIHYWYRLVTVADTNNRLLVAAVLRRPIPKITVLFGIGLLSGPTPILWFFVPTHISSSYEILTAHFLWRLLKWAATKKVKYVLIFVMWLSIVIHFYYNICD